MTYGLLGFDTVVGLGDHWGRSRDLLFDDGGHFEEAENV
jgi:hypothetical protein